MKRILLLFFLIFPFSAAWAIKDWKPIADGLYAELSKQRTPADSVKVLYNLFDLVPRAQKGDVARKLYDSAQRAGQTEVQLDVLRLLTSLYSSADHVLATIEKEAESVPDSREKQETLVFIRMRRLTKSSKFASEKERQDDIAKVLASYENDKKKTERDAQRRHAGRLFNLSVMGPQIFTFVFQMTFSKVHIENPPYVMFLQN